MFEPQKAQPQEQDREGVQVRQRRLRMRPGRTVLEAKSKEMKSGEAGGPKRQQAPVETPVSLPAQPSLRRALV